MQVVLDKLEELEKQRSLIKINLDSAKKCLKSTQEARRLIDTAEEAAQRQVNHWQDELDETDKQINKHMAIARNEEAGY
ncbi:hypothetical protein POF51_22315 [Brevibacillus sp. AG]|uniref:hypothetical protein n=1 Tax=Brevibacillus sp. AG TaxID=3020891 RepID=UPI00232F381B|nr:hypothetical protein [Brevibacillus sp. AG]MDC0763463.1 hypothetical protein [Brevibacillus sp. AG]